jgi:tyrosine-protein phosphatase SIW14
VDADRVLVSRHRCRSGRLGAAAVLLAIVASAGLAQHARHPELPNFGKVDDRLYRGGQPKPGGIGKLAQLGIKAIVNLRGEDEQTRAERTEAAAAGLLYFSIPMPGLSRPTDAQVARAMSIIDAQENWPVFVHCKRGSDRTGTIIAIYRISHDNWTGSQAIAEAKHYGLSWVEFGMKDYISDYYRDRSVDDQNTSTKVNQQSIKERIR